MTCPGHTGEVQTRALDLRPLADPVLFHCPGWVGWSWVRHPRRQVERLLVPTAHIKGTDLWDRTGKHTSSLPTLPTFSASLAPLRPCPLLSSPAGSSAARGNPVGPCHHSQVAAYLQMILCKSNDTAVFAFLVGNPCEHQAELGDWDSILTSFPQ